MNKRIVVVVSALLFALVAVVAGIVTELHDRFVPLDLGARSAVTLDFSESGMSDEEAFRQLGTLSDRLQLGLVKVAPDLDGDQSGQVFVPVGAQADFPDVIQRFGNQPAAEIKGRDALTHTFATGRYLVTGDRTHLAEFEAWLAGHGIESEWSAGTLRTTLELLVRQSDFGMSLLAVAALMVSLVLYWLTARARGRALRVLAGVSTRRIHFEDLTSFLMTTAATAIICGVLAVLYVGLVHNWVFVSYYARVLLTFDALLILTVMVVALVLSMASWPRATMIATRAPEVKGLRGSSVAVTATTFVLVLAAVAPAFTAWTQARDFAAEQAQWKSLSDQVVLTYSQMGVDEDGGESVFQQIMPNVGNLVRDAETRDTVALSYTLDEDGQNQLDLGPYGHLSLVNQRWLDLMLPASDGNGSQGSQPNPALTPLSLNELPSDARQFLGPSMELWSREPLTVDEAMGKVSFFRNAGATTLPLASGGGGGLVFSENAIVVVVPDLYEMFDDSFLLSASSSGNLVFTGLGPTQELVARHGLQENVGVKNVADEGILFAQFTAYFAWLRAGSLVALLVALGLSAVIAAFITAVLKARRDFPLRLSGKPWFGIVRDRVAREWVVGVALTVLVILIRGSEESALVAGVAIAVLLISPMTHILAARWTFTNVSLRRL